MSPPPDPTAATPAPGGTGPAPPRESPPASPGMPLRGLLVDDREGPRRQAADALRKTLPHVALDVASSREEGLSMLDRGPLAFAVLRDGMAWGEGLQLPHALHERLPGVPLILTCDPTAGEAPPEARDPAEAPRMVDRHDLDRAVAVAGDNVAAVTAAVETCLKLSALQNQRDAARDERADAARQRDDLTGQRDALAGDLERSERKVVALLRAAEKHAGREAVVRRRLARVLHEDMLQLLVGARMFLSCAPPGDDGADSPLGEVDALLVRSIQLCKDLTGLWSPLVLYEAGLVAALRWLDGPREGAALVADLPGEDPADPAGGRDDEDGLGAGGTAGGIAGEGDLGPIPAGLAVSVDCDDDAEPATQDGRILLYHAAVELLANVARHSGVDRATLTLRRSNGPPVDLAAADRGAADRGPWLELTVADEGRGFQTGPGTEGPDAPGPADPPPVAGTDADRFGLFGLRERLTLAGGRLEIESVAGEGSTVRVAVPQSFGRRADRPFFADRSDDRPAHDPASPADVPAADSAASAVPLRVLIADDNRIIQLSVGTLLERAGDVEIVGRAADGVEAVSLAMELEPDVILMDVSMPALDGVEATRRIKAVLPGVRVVALSMHESDGRERDMFDAGAERYVVKDGPPDLLLKALRAAPDDPR